MHSASDCFLAWGSNERPGAEWSNPQCQHASDWSRKNSWLAARLHRLHSTGCALPQRLRRRHVRCDRFSACFPQYGASLKSKLVNVANLAGGLHMEAQRATEKPLFPAKLVSESGKFPAFDFASFIAARTWLHTSLPALGDRGTAGAYSTFVRGQGQVGWWSCTYLTQSAPSRRIVSMRYGHADEEAYYQEQME